VGCVARSAPRSSAPAAAEGAARRSRHLTSGASRLRRYLIYLTPLGAWLHGKTIRPDAEPHSEPPAPAQLSTCCVSVIPILENNYAYLLVDRATQRAAVVDPADAQATLRALRAAGVEGSLTHSAAPAPALSRRR